MMVAFLTVLSSDEVIKLDLLRYSVQVDFLLSTISNVDFAHYFYLWRRNFLLQMSSLYFITFLANMSLLK